MWEPPRIPNPLCKEAPGCGEWKRPNKPNSAYKGKWAAPLIDNPAYKVGPPLLRLRCCRTRGEYMPVCAVRSDRLNRPD